MRIRKTQRQIFAALALSLAIVGCSSPEQKLAKFVKEGQEYLVEEEYLKASLQFRNALEIDEENLGALRGLISIAEHDREYQYMFGLLQTFLRLDPNDADAHVKIGNIYLLSSDEVQAQESADKALALEPNNPEALSLRASVLYKLGDKATALQLAQKVLRENEGSQNALALIVADMAENNDFDGAIAELEKGLSQAPETPLLNLLRIELLNKAGRIGEVDGAFKQLISYFPEDPSYYQAYAQYLLKTERDEEARVQIAKIVEIAPDNIENYMSLVRLDYKIGGAPRAIQTFEEAIADRPKDHELKFAYADFLKLQKDLSGAEVIYREFAKQKKDESLKNRGKAELVGLHIVSDRREEAEELLEEILADDAGNTAALTKRAGLKIKDELYDEAIIDLRAALSSNPDDADALVLSSYAFEKKGDPDYAELQLTRAYEKAPRSRRIANAFAKFLINNNKPQRAEEVLLSALAVDSDNEEGLRLLATARLAAQDWSGANQVARILEERNGSNDPAIKRIIGTASLGLQDYAEAITQLSSANEQEPLNKQALTTLVNAYIEEGRAGEAETLLNRMINANPDNYDARILLARVLFSQKRIDDGEAALSNAIRANPNKIEGYDLLYTYYMRSDRRPEAFALIYEGLKKFPENYGLKYYESDILINERRYDDAIVILENLLKRRPQDKLVANNYASLMTEYRTDIESAQKALEVALTIRDVESPFFQDTLGWAYYRTGDFQNARLILKNAVDNAPNVAVLQYHLGAVYVALGDNDRATRALQKSLELGGGDSFRFAPEVKKLMEQAS